MFLPLFDHREFKPTFLFVKTGNTEIAPTFESQEAEKKFMENFFNKEELAELTKKGPEEVRQFVEEKFEEKFGRETYEAEIESYLKEHITDGATRERLVKDSMARYEAKYRQAIAQFYRHTENEISHFEDLMEEIQSSTQSELSKMSQAIENVQGVKSSAPRIQNVIAPAENTTYVGKWPFAIPIVGPFLEHIDLPVLSAGVKPADYRGYREFQSQTTDQFSEFVGALTKQYLNPDLMEAHLTEKELAEYRTLAGFDWTNDGFKDGMEDYVKKQLQDIFENTKDPEDLKKQLTLLRDYIVEKYTTYANEDGLIDLNELRRLNKEASRFVDLTEKINTTEDPEEIIRALEASQFLKPEVIQKASEIMIDQMLTDATKNGTEHKLIAFVEKESRESNLSFSEASSQLKELSNDRVASGAKALVELLTELNKAVNGERAEFLEIPETESKAMKTLVLKQRDLILNRRIEPKDVDCRLVAEFMSANLSGRKMMLENTTERTALFQAIQNIKEHYPKIYEERYRSSISPETTITYSRNPDEPSGHDKIARLLAMLTLAKESEWVIGNLDSSEDLKEKGLTSELENAEADETPPGIDLKFRDRLKKFSTRYRTEASRGGFNGKDIGLGLLKIWGGVTLLVNYMNFKKEFGAIKGAVKLATNPYAYAALGTMYGAHKVQQRPEVAGYFLENEGGQERIATRMGLDSLAKKTGKQRLLSFIGNADEFKAMSALMKDPKEGVNTVQRLKDKAIQRNGKAPTITKDDLKEALNTATGNDAVWSQLPNFKNDRMRYLFYEKFLTKARNIRQFKHDCETWS